MAFGGVELVAELDKIALSLASSSESRAFSLHGGSAAAQKLSLSERKLAMGAKTNQAKDGISL
jgi:hypothetical protein